MLRSVDHAGDHVCTVFFMDVAIGGLLLANGDCWLWAIFAPADHSEVGATPPLGGAAATKAQAFAALERRWAVWLEAASLVQPSKTRLLH